MRIKPSICEVVQEGKVIGNLPTRHHLKFEKFLSNVQDTEKTPVSFRCKYCKSEIFLITSPFGWINAVSFCPSCFPSQYQEQMEKHNPSEEPNPFLKLHEENPALK